MSSGTLSIILNVVTILLGGTLLGVLLRYRLGVKKLVSDETGDIRDHLAGEIKALRGELNLQETNFREVEKHLREMLTVSDKRHAACEQAREENRNEIMGLHREIDAQRNEIEGLKRQIARYSADHMIEVTDAPHATASAERVITELDKQEDGR